MSRGGYHGGQQNKKYKLGKAQGIISSVKTDKGFGFITPQDTKYSDVFFHFSDYPSNQPITVNTLVEYECTQNGNKFKAQGIRIMNRLDVDSNRNDNDMNYKPKRRGKQQYRGSGHRPINYTTGRSHASTNVMNRMNIARNFGSQYNVIDNNNNNINQMNHPNAYHYNNNKAPKMDMDGMNNNNYDDAGLLNDSYSNQRTHDISFNNNNMDEDNDIDIQHNNNNNNNRNIVNNDINQPNWEPNYGYFSKISKDCTKNQLFIPICPLDGAWKLGKNLAN